jgi:hypothetical protein
MFVEATASKYKVNLRQLTSGFEIQLYLWAKALYSAVAWILSGSKLDEWKAGKEWGENRVSRQLTLFFSLVLYGTEISSRSCECIFTLIGFARIHSRGKDVIIEIRGFFGRSVEMGCRVGRGTKGGSSVQFLGKFMRNTRNKWNLDPWMGLVRISTHIWSVGQYWRGGCTVLCKWWRYRYLALMCLVLLELATQPFLASFVWRSG